MKKKVIVSLADANYFPLLEELINSIKRFEESKNIVNKLVLTKVACEIEGDVFYPQIDMSSWNKISTESFAKDSENEYDFKVEVYIKI